MDHQCSSGIAADCRFQDAPFADERNRYLGHCAAHGARPAVLKVKGNELLWIARRLGPDADRGVGMTELMPIALERQNLHGAATAARRTIDMGDRGCGFSAGGGNPPSRFCTGANSTGMSPGCATSAASRGRRWSNGAVRPGDSCGGAGRQTASSEI